MNKFQDKIADSYILQREFYQRKILTIQDEQEKIYIKTGQSKIDMVLNSWMPEGLNFTREIRMLNPSSIIYARDAQGSTGLRYFRSIDDIEDLGKEISYGTGENYDDILHWKGMATSAIKRIKHNGDLDSFPSSATNILQVHIRKDIDFSDKELQIPNPADDKKYPWEKSLELAFGKEEIEDKDYPYAL